MTTSCVLQKIKLPFSLPVRLITSKAKFKLKDEIENSIVENKLKPKHHPGIIRNNIINLPVWVIEAMDERFDDADRGRIYEQRVDFANYLFSRRLPLEKHEIQKKYYNIESEMLKSRFNDTSTEEELDKMRKMIKGNVTMKLKQKVFAWKSLEYDKHRSLLYMITRSTAEYAVLYKIFQEIKLRDSEFNPITVFDFGSGVGSVLWAAVRHWKNIYEYLGIDISQEMNEISEAIVTKCPTKIQALHYRQYLPVSNLKHDLVVSAYSLMELPDARNRLDVISKLWRKTNKYLIIVEQGTNAGFQLVNEARDFVKHMMNNSDKKIDYFTFAPCPHEFGCPRYAEKKTPCNFLSPYQTLPLLGPSKPQMELYSYVVFKKGKRTENDNWHRLVRPTILRSKHVRCRLCTTSGQLQEVIFTAARHGKSLYRCAKASKWGDRLPIEAISEVNESNNDTEDETSNSTLMEEENDESSEDEDNNIKNKERLHSKAPIFIKSEDNL